MAKKKKKTSAAAEVSVQTAVPTPVEEPVNEAAHSWEKPLSRGVRQGRLQDTLQRQIFVRHGKIKFTRIGIPLRHPSDHRGKTLRAPMMPEYFA